MQRYGETNPIPNKRYVVVSVESRGDFSPLPEPCGDVLESTVRTAAEHSLVGARRLQAAEVAEVRSHLDIMEVQRRDERREGRAPRVPSRLQPGVAVQDVAGKPVDRRRVGIAPHESYAGNRLLRIPDEGREGLFRQERAGISPQKPAVAARAAAGASGDVDGERHLVGEFLKDNVCIDIT